MPQNSSLFSGDDRTSASNSPAEGATGHGGTTSADKPPKRATFGGRSMFIFAAIGSAIGLGNIWRFPYISYDNGGGAFLFPYVIALLTAGVPVLILDYVLGHRFRGSAPLV